jgi:hypothetical protein
MSFGRLATGQFRKVLWIPVSLHWHLRDCLVGEEGEFGVGGRKLASTAFAARARSWSGRRRGVGARFL